MSWPDLTNGAFEFFGALAITLSIRQVLKDKLVKGVSWAHIAFFASWGIWNLYYYPSLGQWASFGAGALVCAVNLIWLALLLYYRRYPGGEERPQIVCLCGSTRFVPEMAVISWALERDEGVLVLGLHLLPAGYDGSDAAPDHMAEAAGKKEHFDELHLRKIDLADRILVCNVGGYIGESTRNEIRYARRTGKPVCWLEPERAEVPV